MTNRVPSPTGFAATLVRAVQDHVAVCKHRRKCKTRRLGRTLAALDLARA